MFQNCYDLMQFLQPVSRKRDTFVFIILGGLILIILGSAIGTDFFKQKRKCGLFRITRIFHTFVFCPKSTSCIFLQICLSVFICFVAFSKVGKNLQCFAIKRKLLVLWRRLDQDRIMPSRWSIPCSSAPALVPR